MKDVSSDSVVPLGSNERSRHQCYFQVFSTKTRTARPQTDCLTEWSSDRGDYSDLTVINNKLQHFENVLHDSRQKTTTLIYCSSKQPQLRQQQQGDEKEEKFSRLQLEKLYILRVFEFGETLQTL